MYMVRELLDRQLTNPSVQERLYICQNTGESKIIQWEPETLENRKKDVSKQLKATHAALQIFLASRGETTPPLNEKSQIYGGRRKYTRSNFRLYFS